MNYTTIQILWFIATWSTTAAIVAYNYQSQSMNKTTDIGMCRTPTEQVSESERRIQLVQLHDVDEAV